MSSRRFPFTSEGQRWPFDKLGTGVLLYAYAVLLGASYLFGFWRPIGFNVFPYLGLQDYLSAPLNRISVLVASPILFALIMFGGRRFGASPARNMYFYLIALYLLAFAMVFRQALSRYLNFDFHYPNETSVLVIAALLFLAGIAATIYAFRFSGDLHVQVASLILAQAAVSMAAGYSDGKGVYNGAAEVHFLGNKELCEPGGLRDWVYLGSFDGQTFFLNTIDKRLCLTAEMNIRLVSRKVKENL